MEIKETVCKAYDVVVVGGGIGGVAAAVAAAREGASVLLVEKLINLGGLATEGLISWYEPICDGAGTQMIAGIGEELIKLAASVGFDSLPEKWGGGTCTPNRRGAYASHFSPTFFSLALDKWVQEAGVELLFDSRATYPKMEGNRCVGVIVENVSGTELYPAKVVIDATGDATVMHRAGVPCLLGENYLAYVTHGFTYESAKTYAEDGNLRVFRKWKNAGSDLWGNGHPEGRALFGGVDAREVTEFITVGKARTLSYYEETDKNGREIMTLPTIPQFRKVRHIVGKTTFDGTEDGKNCADSIGTTGDFRFPGKHFAIPYSTLYHEEFPNMLAAGRIISAHGEGWEITRVIPVCALTGEAAGVAAAMAAKEKTPDVTALSVEALQQKLRDKGVMFNNSFFTE
ncbi:MAG: FAD-dependent oxidoreductase [Clostridia bacterium]|nr:FAD-dependent oxidoreductase [Clostridia bacterium]